MELRSVTFLLECFSFKFLVFPSLKALDSKIFLALHLLAASIEKATVMQKSNNLLPSETAIK